LIAIASLGTWIAWFLFRCWDLLKFAFVAFAAFLFIGVILLWSADAQKENQKRERT
jgi:hypothetical protein